MCMVTSRYPENIAQHTHYHCTSLVATISVIRIPNCNHNTSVVLYLELYTCNMHVLGYQCTNWLQLVFGAARAPCTPESRRCAHIVQAYCNYNELQNCIFPSYSTIIRVSNCIACISLRQRSRCICIAALLSSGSYLENVSFIYLHFFVVLRIVCQL